MFKLLYPYVICEQMTYCSFEHVFIGSLVVELVLLFAFFPSSSQNKSVFFCSAGNSGTWQCVAAVVSWKHHNDNVSEVRMLMG